MESAETQPLECDPHPTITVDAQVGENKHHVTTIASPETESFESDAYATTAVGFVDLQAVGSESDGDWLASIKTEHLELDPQARASVDTHGAQAGGSEQDSFVVGSGEPKALECDPYATASVSTVGLQASGSEHDDTTVVSAEKVALESNLDTVDAQAGGSEHDDTVMAAAETEAVGCDSYATADLEFEVSVEECITNVSFEAQNVQEKATILIPGDVEVSVTPIQHLEQEVSAVTQSANTVSNHEGSFRSASPAGETGGEGTFEHIPIHNQEDIQGEEHVFDISEFDLSAHDVPMTGTFFGEHCMFPALDADKAEAWQGSEDDVILMDSSCEHDSDQPGNRDAIPMGISSDTVVNHDVAGKEVVEDKVVHKLPLQTSFETVPTDVVHGLNESSGMNDSHVQGHEKVGGHQCNDADNEHAEVLAPVIVKGLEDIEDPDAHLQGDAEVTFVNFIEKNLEQTLSSEDIYNTNNSMEEVKNEGNLLNATHEVADVHSVKFDHNMPGSSLGLGVESTNSNAAANEEVLHLNTLVGSRAETFKSNEETITQAFGNEENECTDSQSNERSACEQSVEVEKDVLLNERDVNNRSEAAFTAGNADLACALASSKQEENMPVVVLSSEISMEAVVPVADTVVQDKVMLNNKELKVGPVVSHMEVDKLYIKQVEKQIDDSLPTGVKSVEGSDGNVSGSRHGDGEETVEDRGEVVEDKVAGPEQEKEEINEQEELCLKQPVDTRPLQAHIAEEATKQDLTTERTNIASCSDVKSVEGSDGNVLDSRQSDGEESVEDRGEVVEGKVAGPEQEKEEINEEEELCLKPPVDTCSLQAGIAEEATKQDFTAERTNIASSSDADTAASSCSDFTPANELPEGLINDEKPASQSLKPGEESKGKKIVGSLVGQSLKPGEESKGKSSAGSSVGADSLSKKQLEKHVNYHKSPMLKGGNKLESGILAKEDDNDDSDDGCSSEPEGELSDRKVYKAHKEGNAFGIGDLVWAKVRSHPWWPAQIFDPADASKSARKAKKFGRVLVAFFGDCTFAWLQQSQMIAFRPNFREKVKQTTLRIFCIAVEEALEEFCRRSELGLSCAHFKGSLHSASSFPDANTGIREGVRVKRHKDFGSSVQMFRPDKTLEFVKGVACSPLGAWCSTLKLAELRGHVYGLRTCMVASGGFDSAAHLSTVPSHGSKLKRSYSSLEINDDSDAGGSSKTAKKMKDERHSDGKGLTQISKQPKKASKSVASKLVDASEGNKESLTIKFKVSKKNRRDGLLSSELLPDTAPGRGVESERSSDDGRETLLALVGSSVKILKRSSSKEDKNSSSLKKKVHRQTVRESQIQTNNKDSDSEAAASPRTEANAEDVFAVTSSLSEEKVSKAKVKRGKEKKKLVNATRSPVSSIDAEDLPHQTKHSKLLKVGLRDETKKSKVSKTLKEVEMQKEVLGNDKEAGKKEAVRKFSRVGDSIRKVAGELTGTPVAKNFEDSSTKSTGPGPTIKLKDSAVKLEASPTPKKAASKEFTEDVSLLQLRQDLEILANKTGGGSGKAVKHWKKGDQADTLAGKTSPQWQNVPHKTQKSCVQELALAARKRKSEMVHDEVLAKLPKNSSTTGSQRHHASKAYIKGAEKPAEHRSFDKSLSHYSRRSALPASNVKGSSQRYDEKLSSHMPLGLFMRFPEDFPLPSESQLKATFVPFGPLQMSATRLYHDSASAQVVFKHGRDAESAMKHAKKTAMFGPVSVTYRLRHLSHSSKVESKTDTPSPNNVNSSTPVRRPYLAKEKVAGPSVAPENRAGDKEVGTSVTHNNAMDSGSEPTGDIQDKMMTLLRQVSVLVKPSPGGSDGT